MLQLSYLHGNITSLEQAGVGIMAHSRDDVHLLMKRFVQTGSFSDNEIKSSKLNAEDFVESEIVGKDPMGSYVQYIRKILKNYA